MKKLQRLHSQVNKLFSNYEQDGDLWQTSWLQPVCEYDAKVDVRDAGKEFVVTADVPGVELQDLLVAATPHYVSISGEKKSQEAEVEHGYYQMERDYGYFRRVIHLPSEIDDDKIDATFKNGVLTLTLPKTKVALENERKVAIKAS